MRRSELGATPERPLRPDRRRPGRGGTSAARAAVCHGVGALGVHTGGEATAEPPFVFRLDSKVVLPSRVVLGVSGEVDLATAPELAGALEARLRAAEPHSELVVNLGAVTFIGLRGFHTLVEAGRTAAARRIGFRVVGCPPCLRRLVELYGADGQEWWAAR